MKRIISALIIAIMLVSMVCVSSSAAGIHINMNFDSMEAFTAQFSAGQFYVDDGGALYGYAEAKALQTIYYSDEDNGWFLNEGFVWMTYDMTTTLTLADDDLSETDRFVNLVYCNDNLRYNGMADGRVFMCFHYNVQDRTFHLSNGINDIEAENQYMEPVPGEIDTDGNTSVTLGMSIDKGRIRCFVDNKLIFDFIDTEDEYLIAKDIPSPYLFWQDGNFVTITNITIADQGYLFPYPQADVQTTAPVAGEEPKETEPPKTQQVVVTNNDGVAETDASGNQVTQVIVQTNAPAADTNTGRPQGGTSSSTGDMTFVVVAAMVATLGCALIVKKVSVK